MRVIGGSLRGRRLASPKGSAIRPTADRLRESIFNIIAQWVPDAVVLDLFAGTGACGIEALSRSAASAVFIDNNRSAISMIARNLTLCRLEARARVIRWDITAGLDCLHRNTRHFTLVFMDPPYERNFVAVGLRQLQVHPILAPGSRLVVEHSHREPIPEELSAYFLLDQRRYGNSLVSFLEYVV